MRKRTRQSASDLLSIGDKLRGLRTARGLTVQQLAAIAKVPASVISQIEGGFRSATMDTLVPLSTALKLDMEAWRKTWWWEEFVYAHEQQFTTTFATRQHRVAPDSREPHRSMSNFYRYADMDLATGLEAYDLVRTKFDPRFAPLPVFKGGAIEAMLFETTATRIEELVLDAHEGEEYVVCLHGCMLYVTLARPEEEERVFRGDRVLCDQEKSPAVARVEPGLFEELVKREWLSEDAFRLMCDRGMIRGEDSQVVDCEVVKLKAGSHIRYLATRPHGFIVCPDSSEPIPRALVIPHGTYLSGGLPGV